MEREERMRQLPPLPIRLAGKGMVRAVARWPRLWPLMSRTTRRFFDLAAAGWDERVDPDSAEHLAPLAAALDELGIRAERVLELGTGTGAGALMLARRFPGASVIGVDISEPMIERARAKLDPELSLRVEFAVADASALPHDTHSFDLVVLVNAPVFFDEIARVLAPGGSVIVVSSLGTDTPFHTPRRLLDQGFARVGLEHAAAGSAGDGLYYASRDQRASSSRSTS